MVISLACTIFVNKKEAKKGQILSTPHLWKVTCTKTAQKVSVWLIVEIIKTGTTVASNAKGIKATIKEKYNINANEGLCHEAFRLPNRKGKGYHQTSRATNHHTENDNVVSG